MEQAVSTPVSYWLIAVGVTAIWCLLRSMANRMTIGEGVFMALLSMSLVGLFIAALGGHATWVVSATCITSPVLLCAVGLAGVAGYGFSGMFLASAAKWQR